MPAIDDFHPILDRRQTSELTRLIGELDHFRGHWRKLQEIRAERLAQLRQVTTIESTGSSTRIEGAELSNAEVAKVLGGLRVDAFRERDQNEVRGYGELLTLIFESYRDVPLTENHLKQLHGVLLKYSERDAWHKSTNEFVLAANTQTEKRKAADKAMLLDDQRRMDEMRKSDNSQIGKGGHK